jgi:hypothetical protein
MRFFFSFFLVFCQMRKEAEEDDSDTTGVGAIAAPPIRLVPDTAALRNLVILSRFSGRPTACANGWKTSKLALSSEEFSPTGHRTKRNLSKNWGITIMITHRRVGGNFELLDRRDGSRYRARR